MKRYSNIIWISLISLLVILNIKVAMANSPKLKDTVLVSSTIQNNYQFPWKGIPREEVYLGYPRSAEDYYRKLLYFNVEDNIRYKQRVDIKYKGKTYLINEDVWKSWKSTLAYKVTYKTKYTYCNIFVSDITRALGAEVPHVVDNRELTANATYNWLQNSKDWMEISFEEAIETARRGNPTVLSYYNSSGKSGHVAMVSPLSKGTVMYVVQAGAVNSNHLKWEKGRLNPTKYYTWVGDTYE